MAEKTTKKRKRRNVPEGRRTVYNEITSDEKLAQVNPDNLDLENDFLEYLSSLDRAEGTIKQYKAMLRVFWCWNLEYNKNKFFVDLTKREITKFQNHAVTVWEWSPRRVKTVKASLSSLSNYIENILDDEFEDYRPIINKIESPTNTAVREKTVFEDEELHKALDVLESNGEYMKACMLSLAMNSGRRKAELTRFKVSYFDKENLMFNGALYKTPETMTTKGRGKRGKQIYVYTMANNKPKNIKGVKPFQHYLDLWLTQRKDEGIKSEWLFPDQSRDGKWSIDNHILITRLDSWARRISDITGKPFYWHSVRHYFTTNLLTQGIPEGVVQDITGWTSSEMVKLYDDRPAELQFEKYFGAEGIKEIHKTSLEEL